MAKITIWTKEKVSEFKRLYKTQTQKQLAKRYRVTLRAIKGLATRYNVTKRDRGWTDKDDAYLLKNWTTHTKLKLALHFKKTRSAINRRYAALKA